MRVLIPVVITAAALWLFARYYGFPIVKQDETETSRTVKKFVLWMVLILVGTGVVIWSMFMISAAWELVT